jgi:hypothetical protein
MAYHFANNAPDGRDLHWTVAYTGGKGGNFTLHKGGNFLFQAFGQVLRPGRRNALVVAANRKNEAAPEEAGNTLLKLPTRQPSARRPKQLKNRMGWRRQERQWSARGT